MRRSITAAGAVALMMGSTACEAPKQAGSAPRSSTLPELVSISATEAVVGFSSGVVREKRQLPGFRITKHPVTGEWFSRCVVSGGCDAETTGGEAAEAGELALSVSPQGARDFCTWLGGRLPTFEEWLVAARGNEPKRFAWGDKTPECAQHPRAASYYDDHTGKPVRSDMPDCPEPKESEARLVGQHAKGAAPSGLEDVLLAAGELLGSSSDSVFPACAFEAPCVVYGLQPGAIDAVIALPQERSGAPIAKDSTDPIHAYSFRCAFDGESSP